MTFSQYWRMSPDWLGHPLSQDPVLAALGPSSTGYLIHDAQGHILGANSHLLAGLSQGSRQDDRDGECPRNCSWVEAEAVIAADPRCGFEKKGLESLRSGTIERYCQARPIRVDETIQWVNWCTTLLSASEGLFLTRVEDSSGFKVAEPTQCYATFLAELSHEILASSGRMVLDPSLYDRIARVLGIGHLAVVGVGRIDPNSSLSASDCRCPPQSRPRYHASFLSIPVAEGYLTAYDCFQGRDWLPREVEFLKQVAAWLTAGFKLIKQQEELDKLQGELEYQVQVRQPSLLRAYDVETLARIITEEIRTSLDEQKVLQATVREMALGLGLATCEISLLSSDHSSYQIHYEYPRTLPPVLGQTFRLGDDDLVQKQLLQPGIVYRCRWLPDGSRVVMATHSIADAEGPIGLLTMMRHGNEVFTLSELQLCEQIADQCATAVRQARLYAQAQDQRDELFQLNLTKDDFISTVSHELRTPLTNIKLALRLLRLKAFSDIPEPFDPPNSFPQPQFSGPGSPKKGPDWERYLTMIEQECDRELALVNSLLDLRRMESAQISSQECERLVLEDWIPSLLLPYETRAQERGVELTVEIGSALPDLFTHRQTFEGILVELINNACKYTPPGEWIRVEAHCDVDLVIQVSNSGVTIPAEQLERLFDKFYRRPEGDLWQQGGTGLGLAMVKSALQRLGGSIQVRCQEGVLSFTIRLPWQPESL